MHNIVLNHSTLHCHFIPFITGRRSTDEIQHPGLGSSDNVSMILSDKHKDNNFTYLLYTIDGLDSISEKKLQNCHLTLSLSFCEGNGEKSYPIPGWVNREIEPTIFENLQSGNPSLLPIKLHKAQGKRLIIRLAPNKDFLPGASWTWAQVDQVIQNQATDNQDPFTFGHLFSQQIHVVINIIHENTILATAQTFLDVCDARRSGSLYQRIMDKVIKPDTLNQAQRHKSQIDSSFHPWFPVLSIGSLKSALYNKALIDDVIYKKHHLTDPRWLMHVGLFLEFLTCIGIFEAVKDDLGDLLSPEERNIYMHAPLFDNIRSFINVEAWKKVWKLRPISFNHLGIPQTGPVSALNLLHKETATLAFLEVHHEDLKHAIELAGPNIYNAQESWHRVFRDAERAVLIRTNEAFPELQFVPPKIKEFILWNRDENVNRWIKLILKGKKGLYELACEKYRKSMNKVAESSKKRLLIDYTGDICIPECVSLLKAYKNKELDLFKKLQIHDGYAPEIDIIIKPYEERNYSIDDIYALLKQIPVFDVLDESDYLNLALTARTITLAPMERITIQGREGSSLFIIGEGSLEVLYRHEDGHDQVISEMKKGDVFGEISILTKEPRSATTRALDVTIVVEISQQQYEPIMKTKPLFRKNLADLMQQRLQDFRKLKRSYQKPPEQPLLSRLWNTLFR